MKKDNIKLIPYATTLSDLVIKELKGKYFQNILAPHMIFQIPKDNRFRLNYFEKEGLSVWFPLLKEWGSVSLEEFNQYASISEEQFNFYETEKINLANIILAHKDSQAIIESNKANLSEQ